MPSGGARPGAGRPPAENSRAKDRAAKAAAKGKPAQAVDDGDWLLLMREGRSGNPPAWPLSQSSKREMALWRRLWKTPQAIGWEKSGIDRDQVALYVRYLVEAEESGATASVRNLVRQYADGLGLTAVGLRHLHWKIGSPPKAALPAAAEPTPEAHRPQVGQSARERKLQLVSSGEY